MPDPRSGGVREHRRTLSNCCLGATDSSVMSDCIDFKESTIPLAPRWSRRGDGPDEPRTAPEPVSDRAAELARSLRHAWLERNLEAYVPLLRDLAPEFGYSSRGLARALR